MEIRDEVIEVAGHRYLRREYSLNGEVLYSKWSVDRKPVPKHRLMAGALLGCMACLLTLPLRFMGPA